MAWKPGQQRAQREMESPYEGVPLHLYQPLATWLRQGFRGSSTRESRLAAVAMQLRLPLPSASHANRLISFASVWPANAERMLDTVEVVLERYGRDGDRSQVLDRLLTDANSAYTVNANHDGLEVRIDPGVKQAVSEAAASASGSAGDHLIEAWNASYGRTPDPVKSYSESIKAAEAALAPIVSPQNLKQTLGTMIRDVAAKPSKWQFVIADGNASGVETVLSMMRLLWGGQTSRHGGTAPTRSETPEEARAAVHLAASLVQFGASGAFGLAP